ncbi:DNA binding domain-containing protein, excisionase family [Salegentibacter echinorum]|uniref:DNA binding domain-containing protein, excisionase family n=2 Tax=Salegentibacter echinorum TaxID=1073325 RepID=A0A1M5J386_SALEC|nr:DNA binding domain-containing protein, excisionase family [Salegentibacter echinorum]
MPCARICLNPISLIMSKDLSLPKNITDQLYFLKPILTFEEACKYAGLSKSYMYQHTSNGNIPFYKPEGRKIYFKTRELESWMLRNRSASKEEIRSKAAKHSLA